MNKSKKPNGFKLLSQLEKSDSLEGNVRRVLKDKFNGNKNAFMNAFVSEINKQWKTKLDVNVM